MPILKLKNNCFPFRGDFILKNFTDSFARFIRGKSVKLLGTIALCVAIVAVFMFRIGAYANNINNALASGLIRFHVVANSDSPEDQQLKQKVRDAVIEFMRDKLADAENVAESMDIINNNIPVIIELAKNTVNKYGYNYQINASTGVYPFPTKRYGDITLPAGYYQALRVVIGNGEGENWWCVLFPPLCFVDAAHGKIPDSVKEQLKDTLTEEEFKIIDTAESEDEIPVRVKFKIVEFFQESKIKVTGFLNRILE